MKQIEAMSWQVLPYGFFTCETQTSSFGGIQGPGLASMEATGHDHRNAEENLALALQSVGFRGKLAVNSGDVPGAMQRAYGASCPMRRRVYRITANEVKEPVEDFVSRD